MLTAASKIICDIFFLLLACANNRSLRTKYHQGVWNGKKWSCCKNNARNSLGCELCTFWPIVTEDKDSDKENRKNGKSFCAIAISKQKMF